MQYKRVRTRSTKPVQKSWISFFFFFVVSSIFSLLCRIPRAVHTAVSLSSACVPALCASHRFFLGFFFRILRKIRLFTEVRAYNQETFYYFSVFWHIKHYNYVFFIVGKLLVPKIWTRMH